MCVQPERKEHKPRKSTACVTGWEAHLSFFELRFVGAGAYLIGGIVVRPAHVGARGNLKVNRLADLVEIRSETTDEDLDKIHEERRDRERVPEAHKLYHRN